MKLKTKFQDEDFKLGEVVDASYYHGAGKIRVNVFAHDTIYDMYYDSIKDFTDHWEDAPEEPKEYWYIDCYGEVQAMLGEDKSDIECRKQIGNYFETKEEAEKAVEKLKAITRLSKCGFRFEGYDNRDRMNGGDIVIYAHVDTPHNNLIEDAQPAMLKDLDLLFGGEE